MRLTNSVRSASAGDPSHNKLKIHTDLDSWSLKSYLTYCTKLSAHTSDDLHCVKSISTKTFCYSLLECFSHSCDSSELIFSLKVCSEQEVNDTWGVGFICFTNVNEHFETWKHEKLLIRRTGTERKKTTRNDHNFKNIWYSADATFLYKYSD